MTPSRPRRRSALRAVLAPALMAVALAATVLPALSGQAAAQACPSYSQSAVTTLSYTSNQLWTPRRHSVTAGGSLDLRRCGRVPGVGYVIQRPDFSLHFNAGNRNRALEFRVQGRCDTILLINDSHGRWHFADDADGSVNPRLRLPRASGGRYDIWVGTYGPSTCRATLTIETF